MKITYVLEFETDLTEDLSVGQVHAMVDKQIRMAACHHHNKVIREMRDLYGVPIASIREQHHCAWGDLIADAKSNIKLTVDHVSL